jgi:pimeloyl-ACP methyl ester carboxylesterase
MTDTFNFDTADGRNLCFDSNGDASAKPILTFHGSPGSRLMTYGSTDQAASIGVRLLSYDRPGYGQSTSRADRTVVDCVDDVLRIVDGLEIDRFAVLGISGGGPHALATAALLPDRISAVATLCGLGPMAERGFDPWAGMTPAREAELRVFYDDPALFRSNLVKMRTRYLGLTDEEVVAQHASATIAANLPLDYFRGVIARIKVGLAPGVEGMWEDHCAHCSPWGCDLKAIEAPTQIWHGTADGSIPFQHAVWLAENTPSAKLQLVEGESHLSLVVSHWADALHWLATFS